jgi:hypothetical protein
MTWNGHRGAYKPRARIRQLAGPLLTCRSKLRIAAMNRRDLIHLLRLYVQRELRPAPDRGLRFASAPGEQVLGVN